MDAVILTVEFSNDGWCYLHDADHLVLFSFNMKEMTEHDKLIISIQSKLRAISVEV